AQPQIGVPELFEAVPHRRIDDQDCDDGGQQQQNAGRRRPTRKSQRRRAHAMAERSQHRIGERSGVPGPVIAPRIDEEGRRETNPARACARDIVFHMRVRPLRSFLRRRFIFHGNMELFGDHPQIVFRERARTRHQRDMRFPERVGRGRVFDQFRRALGDIAAGDRAMPEHIAQPLAELAPHFGDALVRGAAMGAIVATIFDKGDGCGRGPQHMVARLVDRPVQPVAEHFIGHEKSRAVGRDHRRKEDFKMQKARAEQEVHSAPPVTRARWGYCDLREACRVWPVGPCALLCFCEDTGDDAVLEALLLPEVPAEALPLAFALALTFTPFAVSVAVPSASLALDSTLDVALSAVPTALDIAPLAVLPTVLVAPLRSGPVALPLALPEPDRLPTFGTLTPPDALPLALPALAALLSVEPVVPITLPAADCVRDVALEAA